MSKNTALKELLCFCNQLTKLDVSGSTVLKELGCYNNQLTVLDVSQNTALTWLECNQNQIKGAAMDALVESLPTVSKGKMYIISDKKEQNVMTTVQVKAAKKKGWTPYAWANGNVKEYKGSKR